MANQDSIFAFTHPVQLAFPVLTEAQLAAAVKFRERQAAKGNKQLREAGYEASLLLAPDHPDLADIKDMIRSVASGNYDKDLGPLTTPLKSGDKMFEKRSARRAKMQPPQEPDQEYLKGKVVLVARSKFPVALAVVERGKIVDLGDDALRAANARKFFAGAEALVQVRFAWYNPSPLVPGGGVNAYLQLVMVTGEGKPFPGGQRSAADAFQGWRGHVSPVDPTRDDLDDEIPF